MSDEARIAALVKWVGLAVVACAALLGLNSVGSLSTRWMLLGLGLHWLPASMLAIRPLRALAVWLALFLVMQAAVSLVLSSDDSYLPPPNLSRSVDIPAGVLPGLSGHKVLTTDARGFRVTRPISHDDKPSAALRILAIGASTTEQALLDDRETWTHLLQSELQARYPDRIVEVINAGSSGTRAAHHLATLRATAFVQPDVVLFLVGINDWNKAIREHYGSRAYGGLPEFLWKLRLENTLLGRAIRRASDAARRTAARPSFDPTAPMEGAVPSVERREERSLRLESVAPDYAQFVGAIVAECTRQRVYCVFLTQPHAYRADVPKALNDRFWMTPPAEDYTLDLPSLAAIAGTYNEFLIDEAARLGAGTCDVAARMAPSTAGFYDDCHLNEAGARQFAAAVAACLIDDDLLRRAMAR